MLPCIETNAVLYFVGFSDTETDSVILKKYEKNTNFNTAIDSVIMTKMNSSYEKTGDTLQILTLYGGGDYPLDIHYDYEVSVPLAGKLFQLSDFVETQTEMKVGISMDKQVCTNPITAYTLNEKIITGARDYHLIYLTK